MQARDDRPHHAVRRAALVLLVVLAIGLAAASTGFAVAGDGKDSSFAASPSGDSAKLDGAADRGPDLEWVVALLRRGEESNFERQFCGGSLIAARYVLTAAHCVADMGPDELQVLVGTENLNRGGREIDIASVRTYPEYQEQTVFGDVALLELESEAGYEPAQLVPAGTHYVGRLGQIAGWGSIVPSGDETVFPTRLRSASIPINPDALCEKMHPNYTGSVMLCAGFQDGSPDTCEGDSGGPLARRVDGGWDVVGVTSFGRCGAPNSYGVYSWVGSPAVRGWLERQLGF